MTTRFLKARDRTPDHAPGLAAVLAAVLILALLLGSCDNPTNSPSAAEQAAAAFKAEQAAVLEKTRLDSLKAGIRALKSSVIAWRVYLEGLPDNTADTPYPVAYTGRETPAAIYRALAAAGKYVSLDLSGSNVTGFVHDLETGRALVVHLVLPDSLEEIENSANRVSVFSGFDSLTSVSASGLRRVGTNAFYGCAGLTAVNLPAAEYLDNYAFYGCSSLTTVTIQAGVASIMYNTFYSCVSLATVVFEGNDTVIANGASFPSGTSLKAAYASGGAGTYTLSEGSWSKSS